MGLLTGAAIGGGVTDGRLHSCYPWHRGGAYRELMSPADQETLRWILEFNKFDLYSKVWALQTVVSVAPLLCDKFCPCTFLVGHCHQSHRWLPFCVALLTR